ncbi:MAG: hypothetical protein AAF215_13625 [Cyanobacteria bacterium P01_A01_bin.123]
MEDSETCIAFDSFWRLISINLEEVTVMKIAEMLDGVARYLSEGFGRIFSPIDDEYPNIGVQPFDGEPLSEWINANDI